MAARLRRAKHSSTSKTAVRSDLRWLPESVPSSSPFRSRKRLREHNAAILRTDQQGLITFRTDGKQVELETFVEESIE